MKAHNTQVNYLDTLLVCWLGPDANLSWLLLKEIFHLFNASIYGLITKVNLLVVNYF